MAFLVQKFSHKGYLIKRAIYDKQNILLLIVWENLSDKMKILFVGLIKTTDVIWLNIQEI